MARSFGWFSKPLSKRDVTLGTAHLVAGDRVVLQRTRSDCDQCELWWYDAVSRGLDALRAAGGSAIQL